MRQGYILVELIVVLVIVSLLASIAAPQAVRMRDTLAVEQSARQIAIAHRRARMAAVLRNCAIVLTIGADSITIRPMNDTTTVWRETGPATNGVALAGPVHRVMFSPIGLAMGVSNATYAVTRGDARRGVIVSRLGRIRVTS